MNRCIFATCTPSDYLEGKGVRQRFSIKLTMPFAKSVNLPHKYYGERLACVARFFLFVNNKKEKRQAERAGLESD